MFITFDIIFITVATVVFDQPLKLLTPHLWPLFTSLVVELVIFDVSKY